MSRILIGNYLWNAVENFSSSGEPQAAQERLTLAAISEPPEATPQALRACSACAGDYEDPDRTSWTPDREEDKEWPQKRADEKAEDQDEDGDEFPAPEE